jgi:hypothetical protein
MVHTNRTTLLDLKTTILRDMAKNNSNLRKADSAKNKNLHKAKNAKKD